MHGGRYALGYPLFLLMSPLDRPWFSRDAIGDKFTKLIFLISSILYLVRKDRYPALPALVSAQAGLSLPLLAAAISLVNLFRGGDRKRFGKTDLSPP